MKLTPYDTGDRLEPNSWLPGSDADYGKVDFENDESVPLLTLHISRDQNTSNGYILNIENVETDLTVAGDQNAPKLVAPSKRLQEQVQEVLEGLRTKIEQDEAEVYWKHNEALILVPGEKHVRKQQLILVNADTPVLSAKVRSWAMGVRDTRIG